MYDFKGDGKVDAFFIGDLVRACNLNPTLKTIKEIGGGGEKGARFLSKADVFPMYKACKDSKDQGGFHDFVEILKLYDKNADDTMIGNELFKMLTNLGEKLTKPEAKSLMKELCEPEDEDGFMPFIREYIVDILIDSVTTGLNCSFLGEDVRCREVDPHNLTLTSTKSLQTPPSQ